MPRVQRGARRGGSDDSAIRIDSPDLYALTKALEGVDKKLAAEMKKRLREVAEPVRRSVANEAAWSKRIPRATKVSTRFTKKTSAVLVTVNRKQAPHARPLENDGKEGTFRHPVFARSTRRGRAAQVLTRSRTVKQKARPFFQKGIERQDGRIDAAVLQVAKDFETKLGFK